MMAWASKRTRRFRGAPVLFSAFFSVFFFSFAGIAIVSGDEGEEARLLVHEFKGEGAMRFREERFHSLAPFDDDEILFLGEKRGETERSELMRILEPVGVDMD